MTLPHRRSSEDAGASAQWEYDRRRDARRRRAATRYGPLGAALAAVTPDPASVHAWRKGADGEIATAREFARELRRSDVAIIHDRRIPGRGRANIDHLAVGPGGVTVIDTKSSRGRVQLATVGVIHRREQLLVNGRDRTRELDGLERQIVAVIRVLDRQGFEGVGVLGALCYPYMRRGILHCNRARGGLITVDDPHHIAKLANRRGPLTTDDIEPLARMLAGALPPAA